MLPVSRAILADVIRRRLRPAGVPSRVLRLFLDAAVYRYFVDLTMYVNTQGALRDKGKKTP